MNTAEIHGANGFRRYEEVPTEKSNDKSQAERFLRFNGKLGDDEHVFALVEETR